ncbi:MAG TPA: carbonic anhydrase, partial [Xanthomonadales bacterium]|nr:carbonic anhydrase [Xanthomonadales bacterium]
HRKGDVEGACPSGEALARLKAGNARFLAGNARFPTVQKEVLADLARGQRPFATILGCSDSRVPPELLFDASFGELFVVRVAGNVLGPAIAGSIQYASVHLETTLLLVLGHDTCGAVEAALDAKFHGATHRSRIALLLEEIFPALDGIDPQMEEAARLDAAVAANVRETVRRLRESPELKARAAAGEDRVVVGAVCELATGRVRFFD